jgi:hypothetical protein
MCSKNSDFQEVSAQNAKITIGENQKNKQFVETVTV